MAGISASVCKKIVLSMIGGIPINGLPTTTVAGTPVVTELSLGSLVSAASSIASAASALQQIAQNPMGALTGALTETLGAYAKENFAGLDTELPGVSGNPALSTAYSNFKKSIGGGDGVGGALNSITKLKEHSDRLSGQTLSSENDLSKPLTNEQSPGGRQGY